MRQGGFSERPQLRRRRAKPLRLYTIYGPPEHVDGAVHKNGADAEAHEYHFDGRATE
ncbi:hypothetical protein [Sphingobium herbicidovorans]